MRVARILVIVTAGGIFQGSAAFYHQNNERASINGGREAGDGGAEGTSGPAILDKIEIERVRRLANALHVSRDGTEDMLKAAGDAKRSFPHLLRLVDDVLENSIIKRAVDPIVDRVLPSMSRIINPEHLYRFSDNAVNAGFEVADGLLRAVLGTESAGLADILNRPRIKKQATSIPYTSQSLMETL